MSKIQIHHTHGDPSHAVVKSGTAHSYTAAGDTPRRSTRGFAAVKGDLPALDIQPRHGKAKGGEVKVAWGNRSRTSPLPGLPHMTDINGVPVADAADPHDVLDRGQYGKRLDPLRVNSAMTAKQIAGATFNSDAIFAEAKTDVDDHTRLGNQKLPDGVDDTASGRP